MKKYVVIVLILFISVVTLQASSVNKQIAIKVFTPEIPWADSKLDSKILQSFSRQANMRVKMIHDDKIIIPEFPEDFYNNELLLEWGKEFGGRFIMIVDVQSERIEKRKSFHIPLIFHKYQTYGVIEGELRLFDVDRGKLLMVQQFRVEEKSSRIFQATMDDDINDPDLHLTAPGKIRFFSKLEDKFVVELKKKTKVYLGLR